MSKYLASSLIGVVLLCTGTFVGYAAAGVTERISVNSDGIAGNGHSGNGPWRFVSGDGRYVVFHSQADNLVQGDENESSDIFIHDRDTDVTEIVDVSNLGRHGNRHSVFPEISADGRHIVFRSWKPRDNNPMTGEDYLYVHDRVTKTTEMVSISSTGEAAKFATSHPSINGDGSVVVFGSSMGNLVPNDVNGCADVFLRSRTSGTTTLISVNSAGEHAECESPSSGSKRPSISGDGNRIAFMSGATNLVENDNNDLNDVFVRDIRTGETRIVSVSSKGEQGNGPSEVSKISMNGRYVVFDSFASNLDPDGDADTTPDIFVHDLETGATTLASPGFPFSCRNPVISAEGRFVAFESEANIFVHDLKEGTIERVSINNEGDPGDWVSRYPAINADGTVVAFLSRATNLVQSDVEGFDDIFVRTRYVTPATDIRAGDSDGPLVISRRERLSIVATLSSGSATATPADWWAVARTPLPPPGNFFSYNIAAERWQQGIAPAYQGGCTDYGPREILSMTGLPVGTYVFYFGIDTVMNGKPDFSMSYVDKVKIIITP